MANLSKAAIEAVQRVGALTPEQLEAVRGINSPAFAKSAEAIKRFMDQPGAMEALRTGAGLRTYPEIAGEALAKYREAIQRRDARPPLEVLSNKASANANIIVAREVTAAVREVGD